MLWNVFSFLVGFACGVVAVYWFFSRMARL
jgi:hypothetical protein